MVGINSRIVIPTGACVTSVLTVSRGNLGPILMRPSLGACRVSSGEVKRTVASGAETVLVMRLCNRYTCARGVKSLYGGCGLGLVRSGTRTRNYLCGNGGANSLNSTTKRDFCPNGGLNTFNSTNTMAAGSRRLTGMVHTVTGCNSAGGCMFGCVNHGDHLSRVRTTILGMGLGCLSRSMTVQGRMTGCCVSGIEGPGVVIPVMGS